jgi:lipopolysaccharide/colanic/teichoic acid biosynthesis glycosyltransferase
LRAVVVVMLQTIKQYPKRRIMQRPIFSLQSFNKRTFDIVIAIAGLLMFSPLILLISLWISIESPGPVLCRHKRYSVNNAEFKVLEFRTTLVDREKPSEHRPDDSGFTRFGQILRSSGMSKIPCLISVLCGELSIVGIHLFATAPSKAFPSLDLQQIKPGLVTWAHANEHQREIVGTITNIDCCIDSDRFYIENSSFLFDMKLLLRALLSKRIYL